MIGRTLPRFRILAKIGEGGTGVVNRSEDERPTPAGWFV